VVSLKNSTSTLEARSDLVHRLNAHFGQSLLLEAFVGWLSVESIVISLEDVGLRASAQTGGLRAYSSVAALGFVLTNSTNQSLVEAFRSGITWLTGRSLTVGDAPAPFLTDAVALLGCALGVSQLKEPKITNLLKSWMEKFLKNSFDVAPTWKQCLISVVQHIVDDSLLLKMPSDSESSDVRVVLSSRRLISKEELNINEEDAIISLLLEALTIQLDPAQIAMRIAAYDWIEIRNNVPNRSISTAHQKRIGDSDNLIKNNIKFEEKKQIEPKNVVFITALPVEHKAIELYLENKSELVHETGTIYTLGNFLSNGKEWKIALAQIGMGNIAAASETERAIHFFKPSYIFFVGVAGGIKDVEKGDVVAATKIYGYHSGKAGKTFQPRPNIGQSSYLLTQRAQVVSRNETWLNRLNPTPENVPHAFVGAMAAGEQVVTSKKSETFQLIRQNYSDALAIEMEGYGFLSAAFQHNNAGIHVLVIRGISDLIDDKNNPDPNSINRDKEFQALASKHASAFAFEVLAALE
jgi:nucleoside phosphorylase